MKVRITLQFTDEELALADKEAAKRVWPRKKVLEYAASAGLQSGLDLAAIDRESAKAKA